MVKGKETPHVPASFLQRHPNVTAIIDHAAAIKLTDENMVVGPLRD